MHVDTEKQFPFPENELKRLNERKWILNYLPKNSVGMEIGVFRGHFSEVIAQIVRPKVLYLVDPWTKLGETFGWRTSYANFNTLPTCVAKDEAIARMEKFDWVKVVIVEDFSQNFLSSFAGTVDWVYLDSSHEYRQTYTELCLIDRVICRNGLIVGDDWAPDISHKHHGVFRAVNDFVKSHDYQFITAGLAGQWCIRRSPNYG